MPGIKERVGRLFMGREMDNLQRGVVALEEAYLAGKYTMTPDVLLKRLEEADSSLLIDLVTRLSRDYTGLIGFQQDTETMRQYYVNECRALWRTDVVSQFAVWLWTNYGFGEDIQIIPEDEIAQPVWQTFWDHEQNAPVLGADGLHIQSENVLVNGEFWWIFYIDKLGIKPPVVRTVPTDEMLEIITDPDDDATPLYYRRDWVHGNGNSATMYYPDWLAVQDEDLLQRANLPPDAVLAQEQNEQTMVCAIHVAHNRKTFAGPGRLRGWPMYSAGAAWAKEHTRFRENRASVTAAIAMHVNKVKATAGSRAIDSIKSNLESALTGGSIENNPASAAGSTWVENQALDLQRLSQQTGASDAKADGESLMQMASLGAGAYSHYFGSGDAYRLASATAMETPMLRQWSRYQNFWGAQWRKMVKVVLWAAQTYGYEGRTQIFSTMNADVSTDRLTELDLKDISASMSALLRDGLLPYVQLGVIGMDTAHDILAAVWQAALQALGISDVMEIIPEEEPTPETSVLPPAEKELQTASALVELMKGWDSRMEMVEGELREAHVVGEAVEIVCPFEDCHGPISLRYPGHPPNLLVCQTCGRTWDMNQE